MRSVLWALALAVAHGINPANSKQQVLSDGAINDSKFYSGDHRSSSIQYSGEVRRYPNEPSLLREFQKRNTDIWRITPGSIDVYMTPETAGNSQIIQGSNYTTLPIQLPTNNLDSDARTCGHSGYWTGKRKGRKQPFNLTLLSHDFHAQYHSAANISRFMHSLVHHFPNHTELIHIGHSFEGRKLTGVKIASPNPVPIGAKPRKGFVILGAQHAREWIATSTALYVAHALVADPADQPKNATKHSLRHLLEHFEFYIIPLPNPDGYEYTRKRDRLWYKNRQHVTPDMGNGICKGIDMNRNWGYEWLPAQDPESDPCRHWFPGSRPFEAHEVNALASYLTYRTGGHGHVVAFLDLRSYGQMLSSPYSYSCNVLPRDAEDQIEAALGAARASSRVHGISVSTGRLCETLYSAPGNVMDWAYSVADIKYSYSYHLRDTGTYGFLLPQEWIRPTGEETAALVDYLATFISKDPKV
ncbi:hypothetical protein CPB86DRAFT_837442 [Serendipita vermifera]|nr:hypothetical protein CPB86DRAFT_837442 [Serendipita vermifera]